MFSKLIIRGLGLISTLVLVRLLTPADFGLVAIGIMVIGLFKVLSDIGVNRYLIMHDNPTDDHYSAAWTLNLLSTAILIFILVLLAPFITHLLDEPQVTIVIRFLCLINLLSALKNVGLIKLEKEVDFKSVSKIGIYAKFVSVIVTILAAFYFKNYLALLLGTAVMVLSQLVLSYTVSPFRPKFLLTFPPGMMSYSGFLVIRNLVSFSRSQIDVLLAGKLGGANSVGQFKVARDFSVMPLSELVTPVMQPFFASLSQLKHDKERMVEKTYQILFLAWSVIFISLACFISLQSEFTRVVLGENWLEVGDFIGILAFLMIPFVTQSVFYMLYDLIGKTKNSIWNDIYGLSAIVISFLLFKPSTLIEFAGLRVIVGVSSFIVILTLAKFFLPVSLRKIGLVLAIPLVSSLVTLFTVLYLKRVWEIEVPSLALIFYGGLALVLYALVFSVILRLIRGGAAVFILRLLPELVFNWLKKLKVL
ncbi:MAG: hypothetical protein CL587_00105 [Alteromonadaceae bacterium]|nr:hypothetical protein [Alteromonadaceae bacterium]|tara:strand:+ start:1643 stop:3073 length:1431 start_codon:yes stop_codon:yes gene_type:complete